MVCATVERSNPKVRLFWPPDGTGLVWHLVANLQVREYGRHEKLLVKTGDKASLEEVSDTEAIMLRACALGCKDEKPACERMNSRTNQGDKRAWKFANIHAGLLRTRRSA